MTQKTNAEQDAPNDTTWELEHLEDASPGTPRYLLTVRVRPPRTGREYTWTGRMALTPSGRVHLDEMNLQRSAGQRSLMVPNSITVWPTVKDIRDPREALRAVAANCRQISLHAEEGGTARARGKCEGLRAVQNIMAAGPQSI